MRTPEQISDDRMHALLIANDTVSSLQAENALLKDTIKRLVEAMTDMEGRVPVSISHTDKSGMKTRSPRQEFREALSLARERHPDLTT